MSDAGHTSAESLRWPIFPAGSWAICGCCGGWDAGPWPRSTWPSSCRLKRRVAVKILKPELADDHTYLQRFQREAQAAASLVHANIVQIHEVGHSRRLALHRPGIRRRAEPPRVDRPPRSAGPGPRAVDHAASGRRPGQGGRAGVVHRDIKPENIMLTPRRRGEGGRFRPGPLHPRGRRRRPDAGRHDHGHAAVHEPRAGRGQAAGLPQRHLFASASPATTCLPALRPLPANGPGRGRAASEEGARSRWRRCAPICRRPLCRIVHKMLAKDPARPLAVAAGVAPRVCAACSRNTARKTRGEDLRVWRLGGVAAASDPRLEATRQLAGAMQTGSRRKQSPRRRGAAGRGPGAGGLLPAAACWPG